MWMTEILALETLEKQHKAAGTIYGQTGPGDILTSLIRKCTMVQTHMSLTKPKHNYHCPMGIWVHVYTNVGPGRD